RAPAAPAAGRHWPDDPQSGQQYVVRPLSGASLQDNEKFVRISAMEEGANAAERIIRRFGGQSALAALLGKRQSTIEHWARTGRVPAQWQMPLMSLGRQRGVIVEAKDFVELQPNPIQPAEGRLGILLVGLGAVASTFISGVAHA